MAEAPMLVQMTDTLAENDALDAPRDLLLGASAALPDDVAELLEGEELLGHHAHPLVVSLPIGAWASALLLDVIGADEDAAGALTAAGVVAAGAAVATGLATVREASAENGRVAVVHAGSMAVATVLHGLSYLARRAGGRRTGTMLSLLGMAALSVGGYLGGELTKRLSAQDESGEG